VSKLCTAILLMLLFFGSVHADDDEVPLGSSSLIICQLKVGEKVVVMRTDDLKTLTAFADKYGVATFSEVPDGFWAIIEGTILESWQEEEVPLFSGREAAYNCFNIKKSLRGS